VSFEYFVASEVQLTGSRYGFIETAVAEAITLNTDSDAWRIRRADERRHGAETQELSSIHISRDDIIRASRDTIGGREDAMADSRVEDDRFAREVGIRKVEVRLGFARTEMTVEERHLNGVGILQGGALFTLADFAFALASNSHGPVAVACQADLTWFKPVTSGKLTATAEEISRTRKLSTCLVRITNEEGLSVGLFKGVAYIKGAAK
jgi:acyl-CoA thioesterase